MTDAQRAAILALLVGKLRESDSWTGETHVQKTSYFLQELLAVPLGLRFALYKYGPFSFDLRDQLAEMRGLQQLRLEPQPYPYGPKYAVGPGAEQLRTRFPKTLQRHEPQVAFVASEIGTTGVEELERLATALMVAKELSSGSADERAAKLHDYKPHVTVEQALDAVERVERLRSEAGSLAS